MFQVIGSLLAIFAILSVLAGAPIAGTVFALATFIWVVVAKPARRGRIVKDEEPWDSVYEVPFSR